MVGGGRLVGPLETLAAVCVRLRDALCDAIVLSYGALLHTWRRFSERPLERVRPDRRPARLSHGLRDRVPKLEALLATCVIGAAGLYGATIGGQWPVIQTAMMQFPDGAANAVGFGIKAITIEGQRGLTDDEVLEALRVTDSHSLLFLDAGAARSRLLENPLVSDAAIRKVYPDRLAVNVTERHAFALWQAAGEVSIIAEDGTVIDRLRDRRFADLPLVVGAGAAKYARDFATMLEPYPAIAERLYAGVYVAERRWNLRLRNGVDVLLPEGAADAALRTLVSLIQRGDVLDRDVTVIDLRIPTQILVRLTESAAEEMAKLDKSKKTKGGTT